MCALSFHACLRFIAFNSHSTTMEFTEPQVPMRPSTPPSRMLDTKMLESPIQVDLPQSIESPAPAQLRQDDTPPLRIFVFDTHRTCGMLFNQLLSAHLGLGAISHPYAFASTVGPERIHTQLQHSERTQILLDAQTASVPPKIASITHQAATENFLRQADRLEQKGKTLFVKENASFVIRPEIMLSALRSHETIISKISNPTVIPDELLGLVTPIVFIRHPAIVIPSWWREVNNQGSCYDLDDEDVTVWTSLRWTRMVFDYLRSSKHMQRSQPLRLQRRNTIASHATTPTAPVVASQPYVIDAADVLDNTHAILSMLCRLLDIDTAILNQAWTPTRRFSSAGESIRAGIAENMMKAFSERLQNTHEPKQNKAVSTIEVVLKTRNSADRSS